jgi:hypothetical protein
MTIKKQLKQLIGKRQARRVSRVAPWVGGAIAVAAVAPALRRRAATMRLAGSSAGPLDKPTAD